MVIVEFIDRPPKYVRRLQINIEITFFIPRRVRDVFITRHSTHVSISYHHLDDRGVNEIYSNKIRLRTSSLNEPRLLPTPFPICDTVSSRVMVANSEGSSLGWVSWLSLDLTKENIRLFLFIARP